MDKLILKTKSLPERLKIVRDSLIKYANNKRSDLTMEELGLIFSLHKSTISRILDNQVEDD